MIAITSAGIHVIDVKRYVDQTVEVRRSGGFFSPVRKQLVVGGRDKTKPLLDSLDLRSRQSVSLFSPIAPPATHL